MKMLERVHNICPPEYLAMPELNIEESEYLQIYLAARRYAILDESPHPTPRTLVTFFSLHPIYGIEKRMQLTRMILEIAQAHKECLATLEEERDKEAKDKAERIAKEEERRKANAHLEQQPGQARG